MLLNELFFYLFRLLLLFIFFRSPTAPRVTSADNNHQKSSDDSSGLIQPKKSNSFVESKPKFTISSERLMQLKRMIEVAVRDHKIFTIRGKYWKSLAVYKRMH